VSAVASTAVAVAPPPWAPTLAAIVAAVRRGLEPLRARPPLRLSQWAAEHFAMAGESSHQRGAWIAWPFQIGLMDWMSDDDIEELDVFKAKRIGYTKMLTADISFDAAWRRRNQALWQPTDDDRDSYVKSEIDPLFDPEDGVRALCEARSARADATDTVKYKTFLGCVLHLLGGKAARAYRRITIASAKLDEIDGFDRQIEKSADPVTLARGRLEGAPFPKLIIGSTPRLKGLSHIEDRAAEADAHMRFHIVCPHCQVEHPLSWGGRKRAFGLKWHNDDPDTAHHVCPHCRGAITQADYLAMFPPPANSEPEVPAAWRPERAGQWVCGVTGLRYDHLAGRWLTPDGALTKAPRHVAAYPWAAYSPQREWVDIVREYLFAEKKQAEGENGPMQGFVNETLGETFSAEAEQGDQHVLKSRREGYALGIVPVGCLVLVAFVDVQDNRFHVLVRGFGRARESWIVDRQVFTANPADERDWAVLDAYLGSRFKQKWHGGTLGLEAVGIDTGGHFTHQVYNFVRVREYRRIHGTKGDSQTGKPIKSPARKQDVNYRGQVIKNGVKLWFIGTDTAKDLIFGRLGVEPAPDGAPTPGCIHFSHQLGEGEHADFFDQLTAEGRVLQRTATGEQYRWVKLRPRNEDLDCMVGTEWCAELLDLSRYTDAMWDRLEAAVQPPRDLFAPRESEDDEPVLKHPPPAAPQRPPTDHNNNRATAQRRAGREW
jgi:phage terminase large subunit GpA-like protein